MEQGMSLNRLVSTKLSSWCTLLDFKKSIGKLQFHTLFEFSLKPHIIKSPKSIYEGRPTNVLAHSSSGKFFFDFVRDS